MRQILKNKFWIIVFICMTCALSSSDAFARDGHGGSRRGSHYYRGGRWHRHGWLGFDTVVSALYIGALVDSLPPTCQTVVVGGVPYCYYDNYYYRPYPEGGYVVVQPPVMAQPVQVMPEAPPVTATPIQQPQAQMPETLIIEFPSSKGQNTKVTLKRSGNGYIGPQGEYYQGNPKVEELKVMYGR